MKFINTEKIFDSGWSEGLLYQLLFVKCHILGDGRKNFVRFSKKVYNSIYFFLIKNNLVETWVLGLLKARYRCMKCLLRLEIFRKLIKYIYQVIFSELSEKVPKYTIKNGYSEGFLLKERSISP